MFFAAIVICNGPGRYVRTVGIGCQMNINDLRAKGRALSETERMICEVFTLRA